MQIQIKNRFSGAVIHEGDYVSMMEALSGAIQARADLTRANLTGADLTGANLTRANLTWADLTGADLTGADLTGADLTGADLTGANLTWANLTGADLTGAKLDLTDPATLLCWKRTRILPDDGEIIGWKKLQGGRIAKVLIPAKAKRSHAFGRKCRASLAKVLAIWDDKKVVKDGYSLYDSTPYKVGRFVRPKEAFCLNWSEECASGIHFYITKEEAMAH